MDKETASKEDFEVGEVIGVQAEGPVQRLELSGIMQFSSGLTIGGATLAGFDLRTAQRLLRKEGQLDEIATAAALMIGIALVSFIATLTNGMKASNREAIEEQILADYVVTSLDGYTPFVAAAGDALAASPCPRS